MKRVLAIILAGGILTFAMQLEILARGGGGGGRRRWRWGRTWRWRRWCLRVPVEGFPPRREPHVQLVQRERSAELGECVTSVDSKREHSAEPGGGQRLPLALQAVASGAQGWSPTAAARRVKVPRPDSARRRQRSGESSLPGTVQRLVS